MNAEDVNLCKILRHSHCIFYKSDLAAGGGAPRRSCCLDFLPQKIQGWGRPVPCNKEQDLAILLRTGFCSQVFNQHIMRTHRRGTMCEKHYPPPKSPPASPPLCSLKKCTFPHALVLLDPPPCLSCGQGHEAGSRWADPVLLGIRDGRLTLCRGRT